jgi:hypothetical protein
MLAALYFYHYWVFLIRITCKPRLSLLILTKLIIPYEKDSILLTNGAACSPSCLHKQKTSKPGFANDEGRQYHDKG